MGGNPNIRLPKTTWEPSLALHFAFWECLPPMGFTHYKAQDEGYGHEPKHICRS
jgi:hypothetical protein